ncbi:MAG: insulinase family protein, partial [Clostridia bacterium]|nr:insulinase family protein [Clostridia bacterium]
SGQSNFPDKVYEAFKDEVNKIKQNGLNVEDFERIKKKIYGLYVREYDDVADIARMFLADYFKGINSFDYLEEIEGVSLEYVNQTFNDIFDENKMTLSIVKK